MRHYDGVLFDLFGTLIAFDATRLPELQLDGKRIRTTIAALTAPLAEWLPGATVQDLAMSLRAVTGEMVRDRAADHVELPSRERFRRALLRLGAPSADVAEAAIHLSRLHHGMIADATVFPETHRRVLESVAARHRCGLVSNFDDTASAYAILARHGIAPHLETVVVSEALGLRKPHPALVRTGLRGLALPADAVLFVGDTFAEDVLGARAAGVDAAWIDAAGRGAPDTHPPRFILRTLPDLTGVLA